MKVVLRGGEVYRFMEFKYLKSNLKKNFTGFKRAKVSVLGDSATQLLCVALRGYGWERGLDLCIHEAEYNQIDREINTPESALYQFEPDYTLLFPSTLKLLNVFRKCDLPVRREFAETYLRRVANWWRVLSERSGTRIVQFNFGEMEDETFGHFANKLDHSFLYQLRKINCGLMDSAQRFPNVFINDIAALQASYGYRSAFSPQSYVNADMVFGLDFLPHVAKGAVDTIAVLLGLEKKCLILDLDNTVWGGIVGDDGMENIELGDLGIGKAFTQLQWWARQLKDRGVILAVCSKNEERIAREAFVKHPDMILRIEDIAVFVANWNSKVDNIRYIQSVLNIGFDSMVFLDDSRFEREVVKRELPEIVVPELPADPAEYVPFLCSLNLFATATYSGEDAGRTQMYREEAGRQELSTSVASEEEFLGSLEMVALVVPFNTFNTPRVAQLSQRSNQFNLRTVRYSEKEMTDVANSRVCRTFAVNLSDRFGDYGLISAVILRRSEDAYFIDTWIMSCRVLRRGVEHYVLDRLVEAAREDGACRLIGEYLPTAKNGLVKDHYSSLGFCSVGGQWELTLSQYQNYPTHIMEKAECR
jgi:FkbH-like protein